MTKHSVNFVASPEGRELAVLCVDLGYKLAERVQDLTRKQINFLMVALNYRIDELNRFNRQNRLEIQDSGLEMSK